MPAKKKKRIGLSLRCPLSLNIALELSFVMASFVFASEALDG